MIVQNFKNGKSEIRFENAESLEDAQKNGFPEGVYTRYFFNGKPIQNYQAMVRLIIDETKKTGNKFIPPSKEELKKMQSDMINRQKQEMLNQYKKLRNEYKKIGLSEVFLKQFDENISKINLLGVRVTE